MVTGFELMPAPEAAIDLALPTAPRLLWRRVKAIVWAGLAWYGNLVLKYLGGQRGRVVP